MEALFARLEAAATVAKHTMPYDRHSVELSYGEMLALLQALNLALAIKGLTNVQLAERSPTLR